MSHRQRIRGNGLFCTTRLDSMLNQNSNSAIIGSSSKKGILMNSSEIESRLQALESRVNRYRIAASLLGVTVVGLVGIAATTPAVVHDEVRTHKLVIVDDQGKETAHLSHGPHGGILNIHNRAGFPVVVAGATEKGGKMMLADDQGIQYVKVVVEEPGGQVEISDKKGKKNLMSATPVL